MEYYPGRKKNLQHHEENLFLPAMKKPLEQLNVQEGELLLIDKPYGWTSFAVVAQLKRWTKAKIGHAGTLDPLASGLMILCTGKMTKKLSTLIGLPKTYTGSFHLGETTPTYDLESVPEHCGAIDHLTEAMLFETCKQFTGAIEQYPPIHSAVKQQGKPVYELARAGKEVVMKSRIVTISRFELTRIELPEVHFLVECSSGTYIRSLASDFGKALGCGAYLSGLCRTAIGDYRIGDAYSLDEMSAFYGSSIRTRIIEPKRP